MLEDLQFARVWLLPTVQSPVSVFAGPLKRGVAFLGRSLSDVGILVKSQRAQDLDPSNISVDTSCKAKQSFRRSQVRPHMPPLLCRA